MKLFGLYPLLFIILSALTFDSNAQTQGLQIERLYATSTDGDHSVANLFDGDSQTYWATQPGAGMNEGVMIYFPEARELESLTIYPKKELEFATIASFELYFDGQQAPNPVWVKQSAGSVTVPVGQKLSTLFIRISQVHSSYLNTQQWSEDKDSFDFNTVKTQKRAFKTGIADIIFHDAQGELPVQLPQSVKASVTATSSLKPETAYGAFRLFDGQTAMAWSEGAEGNGIGEKIHISTHEEINISHFKIWNGYQRSDKHFKDNARVKAFYLGTSKADAKRYTLEDVSGSQILKAEGTLRSDKLYFEVAEVYPGRKYQDLVLSEIQFFNGNQSIELVCREAQNVNETFKNKIKDSPLASILDQNINYTREDEIGDFSSKKSLLLRSNGTFVYYESDILYDQGNVDEKNILADGNWTVKSADGTSCVIRIFGKHRKLSRNVILYKGENESEFLRVFQDYLTITPDQIKGQRFIDRIPLKQPAQITTSNQ